MIIGASASALTKEIPPFSFTSLHLPSSKKCFCKDPWSQVAPRLLGLGTEKEVAVDEIAGLAQISLALLRQDDDMYNICTEYMIYNLLNIT